MGGHGLLMVFSLNQPRNSVSFGIWRLGPGRWHFYVVLGPFLLSLEASLVQNFKLAGSTQLRLQTGLETTLFSSATLFVWLGQGSGLLSMSSGPASPGNLVPDLWTRGKDDSEAVKWLWPGCGT